MYNQVLNVWAQGFTNTALCKEAFNNFIFLLTPNPSCKPTQDATRFPASLPGKKLLTFSPTYQFNKDPTDDVPLTLSQML